MRGELRGVFNHCGRLEIKLTGVQEFVSSVSNLLTIRQGTVHLRRRIGELDGQMGDVGRALGEKVGPQVMELMVETSIARAEKGG